MESIRIKGLRSLRDSSFVDLAPLTILLGENSSGKSTFLRLFPLLRQSVESPSRGPLLWYGSYVDFGSFDDAVSHFSESETITLGFRLKENDISRIAPPSYMRVAGIARNSKALIEVNLTMISDTKDTTRIESIEFTHLDNVTKVTFNKNNKIESVFSNEIDFTSYFSNARREIDREIFHILPWVTFPEQFDDFQFRTNYIKSTNGNLKEYISSLIQPYAHGKTKVDNITGRLFTNPTSDIHKFLSFFKRVNSTGTWVSRTKNLTVDCDIIKTLHAAVNAHRFPALSILLNLHLNKEFKSVHYMAPLRATAERYYRNQDLSISEVDFQGKNLAMFVKNLSDTKFGNFKSWMLEHFGFWLKPVSDGGHLTLQITYQKEEQSYNVTDMGFGFLKYSLFLLRFGLPLKIPMISRELAPTRT